MKRLRWCLAFLTILVSALFMHIILVTPVGAAGLDGVYSGLTQQSREISFEIAGGVKSIKVSLGFAGCSATTTLSISPPQALVGNTFSVRSTGAYLTLTVAGSVQANGTASGTVSASASFPGGCGGTITNLPWTATRQGGGTGLLFSDVTPDRQDYTAIVELATRGIVRGYDNGTFGPDDGVQRAQMAALIARATPAGPDSPPATRTPPACVVAGTWDCEVWPNTFADQGTLIPALWNDVAALGHYGVAKGYTAADCAAKGLPAPCFAPNAPVSYVETIAFITRALVAKGTWQPQPSAPQPYAGVPAVFAADVATYQFYTAGKGGVPAPPTNWNAGATRGWFAMALWQALK